MARTIRSAASALEHASSCSDAGEIDLLVRGMTPLGGQAYKTETDPSDWRNLGELIDRLNALASDAETAAKSLKGKRGPARDPDYLLCERVRQIFEGTTGRRAGRSVSLSDTEGGAFRALVHAYARVLEVEPPGDRVLRQGLDYAKRREQSPLGEQAHSPSMDES